MPNNYIGINGLVTESLEEIYNNLKTQFQQIYGTDINLDQNSPDGQWLNILAQEKKDILDLFTQYYNNLDVDRVVGIPQQILYKLNGLTINAYTYSYVYMDITTTQALNLNGISDDEIENADATGYTVSDTNGNRWILTTQTASNTISLNAGLNQNLRFRAAELGSVTALPNTITIMETIIAGITSVNNPANNYRTGATGESDAEFRIRRNRSVTVASQGFADSIEAQLLNLAEVTQAKVYQNRTDTTDANNIPAHTAWVICEGGSESDIGKIIYNNIPPGIPMKGNKTVTITRPNGLTDTVNFDRGADEPLYVKMNIKLLGAQIDDDWVKQELSKLTWNIGASAEAANITTATKDIIGEVGTPYDVEVSDGGSATTSVTGSGITAATVDIPTFTSAFGGIPATATYTFTYISGNWTLNDPSNIVDITDYGITTTGTVVNMDRIFVNFDDDFSEIVTPAALNGFFTLSTDNIDITVV